MVDEPVRRPGRFPRPDPTSIPDPSTRPKRDRKAKTRKKAGTAADSIRDGRLMMRVHQDLVELLDVRSAEAGESRTRYIEKLLLAFLRMDPRNPKLDPWGRIDATVPLLSTRDQIRFGEMWARWRDINERLLGFRVPDDWIADEEGNRLWEQRQPTHQPDDDEWEEIG
ncbi:hypothetical protein JQ580_26685 [Bradyrhizobium japonicum]|uniref:hypothetical protein n=1 Tax=Bradyrhizobium japonicum TaxID=375 RepID=UPI001BAA242E|nr:hypothetical protein [Bradyrhizobium japonicum]MBR0994313.1 hypothetical protein [Bradyrhizobium japonicum]